MEEYILENNIKIDDVWRFGTLEADYLLSLVIDGKKLATSSLITDSKVGSYSIITDTLGVKKCIVKTTSIKKLKFKDMTYEDAIKEGEGDLDHWIKVHYDFFKSQDESFNEDSIIFFEEFELIYSVK